MQKSFTGKLILSIAFLILVIMLVKELNVYNLIRKQFYKQDYSEYVTKYAKKIKLILCGYMQ